MRDELFQSLMADAWSLDLGLFDIYGLWMVRIGLFILLIQDNLPLVDVLNEDSCGPGPDKP